MKQRRHHDTLWTYYVVPANLTTNQVRRGRRLDRTPLYSAREQLVVKCAGEAPISVRRHAVAGPFTAAEVCAYIRESPDSADAGTEETESKADCGTPRPHEIDGDGVFIPIS